MEYSLIKYLLNAYYAPNIVLLLKIQQETEQTKASNVMKLTF